MLGSLPAGAGAAGGLSGPASLPEQHTESSILQVAELRCRQHIQINTKSAQSYVC